MNGVKEEDSIKFKQTSKGNWYCDGATVYFTNVAEGVQIIDMLMTEIENILRKHNDEEVKEQKKKEDE